MIRYVDSSCFLRLAFAEPGPTVPFDGARMCSSGLTEIELLRAIDRARLSQRIDDATLARLYRETHTLLEHLPLLDLDRHVIERAGKSFPIAVRALDAVHVASAEVLIEAGEQVEFWTHDERQALAAIARGLRVLGVAA